MAGKSQGKLDAKEEEQMMEFFTQQVQLLKEKAVLQASVREEKKLLVENGKLKKDIDDLKRRLQETRRKKAMKIHQERVLTASISAMKAAVLEESPQTDPSQPPADPAAQRNSTHTHSTGGRRRRDRRGARVESAACPEERPEAVCVLERDYRPDVSQLDLRIGRILTVRKHPESESLYVQEVDLGEPAPRTVVSGLANHMLAEQLQDSLAVLLCNVKPVKVRGVQSQARLVCAANQDKIEPLDPPRGALPGDRVTFQNYPGGAEKELNPKRRIWERLLPDLRTDAKGVANYKGVAFEVRGKGLCRAPTINNGGIK